MDCFFWRLSKPCRRRRQPVLTSKFFFSVMCSCAIGTSFFLFLLFYIFLFFSFHFIESYYCICFFLLGVVEAVLRSGMEMELITPIVVMQGEERGGVGPKKKN